MPHNKESSTKVVISRDLLERVLKIFKIPKSTSLPKYAQYLEAALEEWLSDKPQSSKGCGPEIELLLREVHQLKASVLRLETVVAGYAKKTQSAPPSPSQSAPVTSGAAEERSANSGDLHTGSVLDRDPEAVRILDVLRKMAVADNATGQGGYITPPVAMNTIAREADTAEKTAKRLVKKLILEKHLELYARGKGTRAARYKIP